MAKSCMEKQKFPTHEEAQVFADEYDNNIVMSFHPIEPYWCEQHNSWHIGHNKYQRKFYPPHSI
jgi:hypothetical protein